MTLTTAEIESGLELAKHPELPPLPWASRARTGGDFAGIITSGSRKADKQVDICYMARGSGRVEGDYIVHAANHYESLAREVLRLREIVERLPKTADGVPIQPGMKVTVLLPRPDEDDEYHDSRGRLFDTVVSLGTSIEPPPPGSTGFIGVDEEWLYSTREAALAVKGAGNAK